MMTQKNKTTLFSCDAIIPISSQVIFNGTVVVEDGIIKDFGKREDILKKWKSNKEYRWNGILTPGLVNSHTHLQYTSFYKIGQTRHRSYEDWCDAFDHMYSEKVHTEDWRTVALKGADLSIKHGSTTLADISTNVEVIDVLKTAKIGGYCFIEVMGESLKTWQNGERSKFIQLLEKSLTLSTDDMHIGISPHATYSLDTPVIEDLVHIAKSYGLRVHTHMAESEFEDEYCMTATGPLADMVSSIWSDFEIIEKGGVNLTATEFTCKTGQCHSKSHVAHGIYVSKSDRALLKKSNTYVALCPRSNVTIGLKEPPIAAYLKENVPIAVGTDSLSSSPSLDLLEDVRLLWEIAIKQGYDEEDLPYRLLHAATLGGAKCLGIENVGSIEKEKKANFAVFDLSVDLNTDPIEQVVKSGAGKCIATVILGDIRYAKDLEKS